MLILFLPPEENEQISQNPPTPTAAVLHDGLISGLKLLSFFCFVFFPSARITGRAWQQTSVIGTVGEQTDLAKGDGAEEQSGQRGVFGRGRAALA